MTAPDEVLEVFSPTLAALRERAIVSKDEDEQAWLDARKKGCSATDAVRLRSGSATVRRTLRMEKVAGEDKRWSTEATRYGSMREPFIGEWVERKFAIAPSSMLYRHADFDRHLATPDGVGVDYDDNLRLAEIKTSEHDLTPGPIDGDDVLMMKLVGAQARKGYFWSKTRYYEQMQWQMWVTGADRTLFVWEQHNGEHPLPTPLHMEPRFCWILRDDALIADLVEKVNVFLAEWDDLGGAEVDPEDYEFLLYEWRRADDAVKAAMKRRDEAAAAVVKHAGDQLKGLSVKTEHASAVYITEREKVVFDEALWARRAPAQHAAWLRAQDRYTTTKPGREYLRLTATKAEKETEE